MHKRYPRSSDLRFSTDPQNVLKFLKRSSKPSKSSEVHKRYSSRHQSPQEVINVVKILWSSKVPQMFIKWSSKSPQNFLKTVLKWSTRGHQKFQKGYSMFWDPHVHRSSKSPKRSTKSSKSQENAQKVPKVFTPQVLKWSSKCPLFPQKCLKSLEVLIGPQKVFVRHQSQEVINVVKILWSSKVPQMFIKWSSKSPQNFLKTVLKWSTRSHQKFQKGSSMFWEHQVLRSLKSPQKVHKVLKKSRKCTKGTQGPQTSGSQMILKISSISSKGPQIPRSPHRSTKGIQGDFKVLKN